MKKSLFLILTLAVTNVCFSQTGPGGVGIADGSGSLIFWVKADVGVEEAASDPAENGDAVSTWIDQSGSGNSATSPSTGAIYTTSIFNSLPVLRFSDNDNDRLTSSFVRGNNENLFLIGSNRGNTNNTFVDDGTSTNTRRIFTHLSSFRNPSCAISFPSFISNPVTSIINNTAFLSNFEISSTGNEQHWVNGNLITSGSVPVPPAGTSLIIGNNPGTLDSELDGDIAEIIVFNTAINSAQRIIINNYLAAKYDLILSLNDLYTQDNFGNGNYDFEVAGIGRIDASNIHNDAQGSGIVRILNPTGLDNDEFLIWGHNNGVQQATETTDVPATVQARFDRTWRVSEVNTSSSSVDVGSIDIRFDLTGLGNITTTDLRLLIDTDNDGIFIDETPISGATSIGGNVYQFAGVSAIANNLRFTLGTTNTSQTPLPIELLNFNVKTTNDESVKIFWQTASETNNDYFSIERSQNGYDWNEISRIDGAGNSSSQLDYTTYDLNPFKGISYYRLKQTDFDGEFSFSTIKSINNSSNNLTEIYPNPTSNKITLIGDSYELEIINVYNIVGENVTNQTTLIENNNGKIIIDFSKLSTGTYYIRTKTTANKVYKSLGE